MFGDVVRGGDDSLSQEDPFPLAMLHDMRSFLVGPLMRRRTFRGRGAEDVPHPQGLRRRPASAL